MKRAEGAEYAAELLRNKHAALEAQGLERLPQRSDFSAEEIVPIKAHLGPFPRALEAAGLKPPRDDGFADRKLQKRIAAKRKRTAAKIEKQKTNKQNSE